MLADILLSRTFGALD